MTFEAIKLGLGDTGKIRTRSSGPGIKFLSKNRRQRGLEKF
jgi:hypothetical protein